MHFSCRSFGGNMEDSSNMDITCPTCCFSFKLLKTLKQHHCLVKICSPEEPPDLVVRDEQEISRLMGAVGRFGSSPRKIIKFCQDTGTVLPGLYPFYFPTQRRNSYPILRKLGSVEDSYGLLKEAAREGPVRLPRRLKIRFGEQIYEIDSSLLMPSNKQLMKGFSMIIKNNHIRVLKKVSSNIHFPNICIPTF